MGKAHLAFGACISLLVILAQLERASAIRPVEYVENVDGFPGWKGELPTGSTPGTVKEVSSRPGKALAGAQGQRRGSLKWRLIDLAVIGTSPEPGWHLDRDSGSGQLESSRIPLQAVLDGRGV